MKNTILFLVLILVTIGNAQRFDWVNFISSADNNSSVSGATDMVRDADGNLFTMSLYATDIMVGDQLVTHEGFYYNNNMVIIKWNPEGEIIAFKKVYAQSFGLTPHHMAYDQVNNQLVLSTDVSGQPIVVPEDNISLETIDTAHRILRFDSNLEFISSIPNYYTYDCPIATRDGFIYYAHGYNSTVFKVNSDNEQQWAITPLSSGAISIYNLTVAPDGNIFVSARVTWNTSITFGNITVTVPPGSNNQMVLFKISPEGEVLAGNYVTQSTPFGTRMPLTVDADGNVYAIAEYSASGLLIGEFPLENVANGNDIFVVKLDQDLQPVWVTQFHNTEGNMQANDIKISESGHIIAVGKYVQSGTFGNLVLPYSNNGSGYLAKLDPSDGTVLYATQMASNQWTSAATALVTNGTSFYVTGANGSGGTIPSFGCYPNGNPGMFLTKIEDIPYSQPTLELMNTNGVLTAASTSEAQYQWYLETELIQGATNATYTPAQTGLYTVSAQFEFGCSAEASTNVTSLSTSNLEQSEISVYPNPATEMVFIRSGFTASKITISDMNGRIVLTHKATCEQTNVDINQLQSGIYILQVVGDGHAALQKIIKN